MTPAAAQTPEAVPIQACTVSRDLWDFSLLVEDMDAQFGAHWGDLGLDEALTFLLRPEARGVKLYVLALDSADEADETLEHTAAVISAARARGIRVLLVAENLRPASLHRLLRAGAADFVPYPLPEGALSEAVTQPAPDLLPPAPAIPGIVLPAMTASHAAPARNARVFAVHGMAGGVGASTFAANLAWELANPEQSRKSPQPPPRVCLIDLDLQFGAIATYLDLPRRELVFELLSDTAHMDTESFAQALLTYRDRLHVLTAPADMLPLDFITGEDVTRLITLARSQFDYVIIDMPQTLVAWSEAVLTQAHSYFVLLELEMRSAQNMLRMMRALRAEALPIEKLRPVLNRAPKFTDMAGRGRVKRMAENLGITFEIQLPEGGTAITAANDQAEVLALSTGRAPLRREIQKLARTMAERARAALT